jgi:hypothetical protein
MNRRLSPDYLDPSSKWRASLTLPIRQLGWPSSFGAGTGGCTAIALSRRARLRERK